MADRQFNSSAMRVDFRTMRLVTGFGAGLVTFLLFVFGSIIPVMIPGWDVETICITCGSLVTAVVISHFVACYMLPAKDTREATFVVYWFLASLFFDLVWEIPLWATSIISSIPHLDKAHLKWAIIWWSYSVSDTMYRDVTRLMVTFEVWYLLGNIPGFVGLWHYVRGRTNKALLLFFVCGILQCYNATVYLAISWYVHNCETVNPRGYFIFWGLNACWACSSAVAAALSYLKLTRAMNEREKSE